MPFIQRSLVYYSYSNNNFIFVFRVCQILEKKLENSDGNLSTEWVRPLYESARRKYSDRAIAVAAGFLTHCAGDIYGHPFMNNYAGGPFVLGENALKHIVLESYIDNRTPKNDPNFYQISIDGIERWIYDNLIATSLVWDDAQPENLTNYEYHFNFSPGRRESTSVPRRVPGLN